MKEEKKYREYCAKYDATTSKVHHSGPKRMTRNNTRNASESPKLTYEKGDSVGSDEEVV